MVSLFRPDVESSCVGACHPQDSLFLRCTTPSAATCSTMSLAVTTPPPALFALPVSCRANQLSDAQRPFLRFSFLWQPEIVDYCPFCVSSSHVSFFFFFPPAHSPPSTLLTLFGVSTSPLAVSAEKTDRVLLVSLPFCFQSRFFILLYPFCSCLPTPPLLRWTVTRVGPSPVDDFFRML